MLPLSFRSLVIAILCVAAAACGGSRDPVVETISVLEIDDSAIPQAVKYHIFYDSNTIISRHVSGKPAETNPDYPSGKVVVIRVETSDYPRNTAADTAYISELFFGLGASTTSIRNYFLQNSYSKFVIANAGVPEWVTLRNPLASYQPIDEAVFLKPVLELADVDWTTLDADKDGKITRDEVTIIYLLATADSKMTKGFAHVRYPAAFDVNTPYGTFTFELPIIQFSLVEESDPDPHTNPIRVLSTVAHEFCHSMFNLTDRYTDEDDPQYTTGVGNYDIMSYDHTWKMMTMYDRMKIGWIQPKVLASHLGKNVKFVNSESAPQALVLLKPAADPNQLSTDEMWIVENRYKPGSQGSFDADLPESGMAVWWVRKGTWAAGTDEVRLVDYSKADQTPTLYTDPGNTALFKKDAFNFRRDLYEASGSKSGLYFMNVSDVDSIMLAEF